MMLNLLDGFETTPAESHWYNYIPTWIWCTALIILTCYSMISPIIILITQLSEKVVIGLEISSIGSILLLIIVVVLYYGIATVSRDFVNRGYQIVSDPIEGPEGSIDEFKLSIEASMEKLSYRDKNEKMTRGFILFVERCIRISKISHPFPHAAKVTELNRLISQGLELTADALETQRLKEANKSRAEEIKQAIRVASSSIDARLPDLDREAKAFAKARVNSRRRKIILSGIIGIVVSIALNIVVFCCC